MVDPPTEVTPTQKIVYIDRIKVLLTLMVILHHVLIAYGAPGKWYYSQPTQDPIALIPMSLLVGANQAYMMALFFMLAAYFIEPSYQRKGPALYTRERLVRLGLPLLGYSFVLSPMINYPIYRYGYGYRISFLEFLTGSSQWMNVGVLWFVAALLLFTLLYIAFRRFATVAVSAQLPSTRALFMFAGSLGLIGFLTRLYFPVGWALPLVDFQLGHFPQYIAYFGVGLLARQNHWFDRPAPYQGRKFAGLAAGFVLLVLPLISGLCLVFKVPMEHFNGGWSWAALAYSLWEQVTGLSIIVALMSIAQKKWIHTNAFWRKLARHAFGVYIFHPLVIVLLTLLFSQASLDPLLKLVIVAPLAVVGSFLLVSLVRQLPKVTNVL